MASPSQDPTPRRRPPAKRKPAPPAKPPRLVAAEAWVPLILRVSSFFGGMGIMFWQTVLENADRPYLIAAATGMMGLPVANIIGRALAGAAQAAGSSGEPPQ